MCIRDRGRVIGYEHKFVITDNMPYCIKGWPIPLKYQEAVDQEVRTVSYTHLDVYKRQLLH